MFEVCFKNLFFFFLNVLGLSPAEAIHYHEDILLVDGGEKLADASINPPKHWVYHLHRIWRKNEYGGAIKDENFYK